MKKNIKYIKSKKSKNQSKCSFFDSLFSFDNLNSLADILVNAVLDDGIEKIINFPSSNEITTLNNSFHIPSYEYNFSYLNTEVNDYLNFYNGVLFSHKKIFAKHYILDYWTYNRLYIPYKLILLKRDNEVSQELLTLKNRELNDKTRDRLLKEEQKYFTKLIPYPSQSNQYNKKGSNTK